MPTRPTTPTPTPTGTTRTRPGATTASSPARAGRLRAVLAAALLVGAAAAVLPASPAAAAEQSYPLTADGLPLVGHGYGHGRGMGQYGAQGAALRGLSYAQILGFYYPGTDAGRLPGPGTLRVLLNDDDDDDVTVWPAAGLGVSDADGRRWVLPVGPERWRVVADPSGGQHVEQLVAGRWSAWDRPGGGIFSQARFDGPARIRLALPSGTSRSYRGTLTAAAGSGSALTTVNEVGFQDYLRSVVPSESPASFAPQALQAQSVAARTYAAYKRAYARPGSYDICSTTACQVYVGAERFDAAGRATSVEDSRTDAAVAATDGEVRTYAGRLALTEFTSSTGGWNAAGGVPYLKAQPDPYDDFAGNPVHTWRTTLTPDQLAQAYPQLGTPTRVRVLSRDGRGDWGGRTTSVALDGTAGSVTVTGDALRSRLGLREAWWDVDLGLIGLRWRELGGSAGLLGPAVGTEYDAPGGRAQDYRGGRILWSPATGAREVHGLIGQRYDALGGAGGWLGLPTSDEYAAAAGRASDFVAGRLYWSPGADVHEVHGLILQRYLAAGGPDRLGLPASDEQVVGAARRSVFPNSRILWSAPTGAHVVEGKVLEAYVGLGEAGGLLGLPLTDEQAVVGGRASRFQRGDVYWSGGTGAHEVHGSILARYARSGGPSSTLGLPVSDEYAVPQGRRSDFTGGSLVWDAASGTVSLVAR